MRLSARLGAPALAGAGALQTLAFVVTQAWALPIATLAVLVWRLSAATSPARAAWLGWSYAWGWLAAGTWWLFVSMHRYGGLPAWMAALATAALAAALALYVGLAAWLFARFRRRRWPADSVGFAALWLLAELARGVLFTGFPWVASGYSQLDGPLAALAPWVGVYGMGGAMALVAAGLGLLAEGRPGGTARRLGVLLAVLAVIAAIGPREFSRPAGRLEVSLLQTHVAQDEKFAAAHMPEALGWLARELVAARGDLVVAPETAVPLLPDQLETFVPGYWAALARHFSAGRPAALIGVPLGDERVGYTNSVVGLGGQAPYRYDKFHLVPFGEFIPPGFRWFTQQMNIPLGDFARGVRRPPSFAVGGQRLAPNICYEDLFGEELARRFAGGVEPAPTVLVNLSNIGWFGRTVAVEQHLHISRLRALELQRPMLRATNTGATAIIDHRGRVQSMLPPHTRGVLVGSVEARSGSTPFALWAGTWSLWPLLALGAGALLLAWGPLPRPVESDGT